MTKREEIVALEKQYILQTYRRSDFVVDRGEGVYLYDTDGRRYLDFVAGIAVNALGYGDPEVLQTIAEQSHKLLHVSNLYETEPPARLAKMLVEKSFADRIFFCNSGAEANEAAFKFARKWGRSNGDRYEIISLSGAFHGRTFGALAATPKEHYQAPFRPLIAGVKVATFNDLDSVKQAIDSHTCAIIVEPIQGEGGVYPASVEFMQGLRHLCDERSVLLIADEVQAGFGRTGTLWAYQYYGIEPDIMSLAKPLGGGMPMGATLVRQAIADYLEPGDHGTTFGANALISSVAQVIVRRISEPRFLAHVRETGEYLGQQLKALAGRKPCIKDVRGRGLIWGIELDREVTPYIQKGYEQGIIVCNAGTKVLRLLPPLVIGKQHVDELIAAFDVILPGTDE